TKAMRDQIAGAVAGLFVDIENRTAPACSETEQNELAEIVKLAVLLRGHVQRDGYTHEITNIHQPEGPGRLGLMLERLLVGLDAMGLERRQAMELAKTIKRDSCPPLRVKAFNLLKEAETDTAAQGERTTRQVALELRLPTSTARRTLEDLERFQDGR